MAFYNLNEIEEKEPVTGFKVKFIHAANMTLSFWRIEAGAVLPRHSHPHEQMTTITEGRLSLCVGDETRILEPGEVAVIPSHTPHSGQAVTDCRVTDVFYPVREDYRNA